MCKSNKPCRECPWRKDSLPGWLGASAPLEFLALSESETRMPCHMTVDYEQDDWQEQVKTAPQCVGRSVHFANRCRLPKNKEILRADPDPDTVFTDPRDFYKHHGGEKELLIVGHHVIER